MEYECWTWIDVDYINELSEKFLALVIKGMSMVISGSYFRASWQTEVYEKKQTHSKYHVLGEPGPTRNKKEVITATL
jgi:hypothetical protein